MTERLVVAALIVVGFALTATNGVLAYRSAKDRLTRLGATMQQIRAAPADGGASHPTTIEDIASDDAVQRVLHALQSSRTSLLLAGLGLLISTVAAVWGLFLPA